MPTSTPPSPAQLAASRSGVKAVLARLATEVDARKQERGFREALDTMARFWRYSYFNQLLIHSQRPRARLVNCRKRWEAIGRHVVEGAEPIQVLAPARSGNVLRFVSAPVYDVRDTRGRRIARLDMGLRGRTHHVRTLEAAAEHLGIRVDRPARIEGALGRSFGGHIEVLASLAPREQVAVLAHELAHEVLHQRAFRRRTKLQRPGPRRTKTEKETEAEATSYVVLSALGLPSKAPTYIAWQGGTGQAVLRSMKRVQQAASAILVAAEEAGEQ